MPTRAPGGNTGPAAGTGFVAATIRSTAANRRRIRVMKNLSVCIGGRAEIGRVRPPPPWIPASVGPLLAVLPPGQQGGNAFVPGRFAARLPVSVQRKFRQCSPVDARAVVQILTRPDAVLRPCRAPADTIFQTSAFSWTKVVYSPCGHNPPSYMRLNVATSRVFELLGVRSGPPQ